MPSEIVGITGTRNGLTDAQVERAIELLQRHGPRELHHGDCVGADEQVHQLTRFHSGHTRIVVHPPANSSLRAFCDAQHMMPERDYLTRNRNLCEAAQVLWAFPKEATEQHKGGTWYTIRYARSLKLRLVIIWPNGEVQGDHAIELP